MVIIADPGLNRELDKYISSRREPDGLFGFLSSKPKQKPKAEPVEVQEGPGFWERLFGKKDPELVSENLTLEEKARLRAMQEEMAMVAEAEEEHPEAAPELEEVRESLWERFTGMFRSYERRHRLEEKAMDLETYERDVLHDEEEVRKTLKTIHKWLERLPMEEKQAFRRSPDFQEYKALLEKYSIAKKAQPAEQPKPALRPAAQPATPAKQQPAPSKPAAPAQSSAHAAAAGAAMQHFAAMAGKGQSYKDDPDFPDLRTLKKK